MPRLETPIRRTDYSQSARYAGEWETRDRVAEAPKRVEVPPAFYRDADEPPPPPDDPHWREWPRNNRPEPVPRFLLLGVPILLGVLGVFHIAVILLVFRLSGLY